MRAVRISRDAFSPDEIVHALARHDRDEAERVAQVGVDRFVHEAGILLRRELTRTLTDSGKAAARLARSRGKFRAARRGNFNVQFQATNPRALAWAEQRSAKLVVDVSRDARAAIRDVVGRMFSEQFAPREAAREIRQAVGLTSRDADAVGNLRARLEDASGERVSVLGGRLNINVPEDGFDEEDVDRWTSRYADELLDNRTETIARTESVAAANEGQRELWEQSIENGWLAADATRVWLAAESERTCPICQEMDGQVVGVTEDFELPEGDLVSGPPAHPDCRCGQGISDEPSTQLEED